jgi:hypothetical protein
MAVLAGLLQSLAGLQEDPSSIDHLQNVAAQVQQLFQVKSSATEWHPAVVCDAFGSGGATLHQPTSSLASPVHALFSHRPSVTHCAHNPGDLIRAILSSFLLLM